MVSGWLPQMLEGPAPTSPNHRDAVLPAGRPVQPEHQRRANRTGATLAAGHADGAGLAADFTATWQRAYRLCRDEPRDRVVRTRHGDAMLLSEFLLTRVVEVAVHGWTWRTHLSANHGSPRRPPETVLDLVIGPAIEITCAPCTGTGRLRCAR